MVAIVSGNSLGLFNSSLGVLGAGGAAGQAQLGRSGEGVYLNVATGNLVMQRQDELLVGVSQDMGVIRTYNSQGQMTDDNGDNWRLGVHGRIGGLSGAIGGAGSTIRRIGGDGVELIYTYDSALGSYVNKDGAGSADTLTYSSAAANWTWRDGNSRVSEVYDWIGGSGKLLMVRDLERSVGIQYSYTGNLLTQIVDELGEKITFEYVGTNLVAIRTVDVGNKTATRVRYGYDASNRLTSVTVDLTPEDNSVADGKVYVTTYAYDGTSKRVAAITQTDGSRVAFVYQTLSDGSVRVSQITQTADAGNRVTNITYDLAARTTSVTEPLGNVTRYRYDALGRLLNVTPQAAGDGLSNAGVSYAYDADGNVVSQTDGRGNMVSYTYDGAGNELSQRDAAGNTVVRTYGAANEQLTETRYLVADPDGAGTAQASVPVTTRYVYDNLLRLRFAISAAGRVSEYRYGAGSLRLVTDSVTYAGSAYTAPTGTATQAALYDTLVAWVASAAVDKTSSSMTRFARDNRGQVSSTTVYARVAADGSGVADGTESVTRYVYDQAGQLLMTVAPRGTATTAAANDFVTRYVYDGMGRLLSTTDALNNVTLNQYDDAGNTIRTTLASGLVTISAYNKAGELITLTQSDGSTVLGVTSYQYGADGQVLATQNPLGQRSRIFYDAAGRKVAEVDANGSLTEWRYNQNDQVIQSINRFNAVAADKLATLFDANGKVVAVTLTSIMPAASATGDVVQWRFYDVAGRLAKTRDPKGSITEFKYDGAGRLVTQTAYAALATGAVNAGTVSTDASVTPTAQAADRIIRSFYDDDGLLLGKLDAMGFLTENVYDQSVRLVHTIGYATITNSSNSASGTLAQLRPAAHADDIHGWILYDAQGRKAGAVDGEGYLTEWGYDANGNVTQQLRYAARAALAPTAITATTTLAALRPGASAGDQLRSWTYTDLNQVKTETNAENTVTQYTYNSIGQVTSTERAYGTGEARLQQVRYDVQGRVSAELSAEGSAALAALVAPTAAQVDALWLRYGNRYTYDAAGRRTTITDANGATTRLYYDTDGQVRYTVNALGEVTQTSYNALHQLAQTRVYASRIGVPSLAAMTGGDAAAVAATMTALANPVQDSVIDFTYNQRGTVESRTDAEKYKTTSTYNNFGELAATDQAITGGSVQRTDYTYDRRGLVTRITGDLYGIAQAAYQTTDAFGRVIQGGRVNFNNVRSAYDRLGRVVSTTDAANATRRTTYDAFDTVMTSTDANGKVTRHSYDKSARSMTITTPEGISTVTTRNRYGEVVQVRDGRGNTSTHVYDKNGNLASSTDDAGNATTGRLYDTANRVTETRDANGVRTKFEYDAANRLLLRTVDADGLKLVTSYTYDAKGQVATVTDPAGVVTQTAYDNSGQVKSVTVDPAGLALRTEYTYDGRGKTLTVTEGAGSATARVTQYTYDKLGRRTEEVVDPAGLKLTTAYVYDINDNVMARTDAVGTAQQRRTLYTYDVNNRLGYTIDALGGVIVNRYNIDGTVREQVAFANPLPATALATIAASAALSTTSTTTGLLAPDAARDRSTRHFYDQDGQMRFTVDALGAVLERQYDGNGNVLRMVQYANGLVGAATAGVLPVVVAPGGTAPASGAYVLTSAADRVTTYGYDSAGRLTVRTSGVGTVDASTVRWDYDKSGNAISYVDGRGNRSWTVYDGANRIVREIDAAGYVTSRSYYSDGALRSLTRHKNKLTLPGTPDASWGRQAPAVVVNNHAVSGDQTTVYTYDKARRLDTQTLQTTDVAGSVTRYSYDALGNVVETIAAYGTAKAASTRRTYDLGGRVLTMTRAFGTASASTTRYQFDSLGNQTDIFVAEGTAVAQRTVQEFDLSGRKVKVTVGAGSVAATSTSTVYNAFGDIVKVIDARGSNGYFYNDALGRVTLQVGPDGAAVGTRYDLLGNAVETVRYANRVQGAGDEKARPQIVASAGDQRQLAKMDALGRTSEIQTWYGPGADQFYVEKFTYDGAGNVLTSTARNGYSTTYEYDKANNKTREILPVKTRTATGSELAVDNRYDYDALGKLVRKVEAYGAPEQRLTLYGYDQLNRLVSEKGAARLVLDPVTRQEVQVTPESQRVYDARGNLIEERNVLGGRTLHYFDILDREVGRIDAAGAYTSVTYDAAGNKDGQTLYVNGVTVAGGGAIANGTAPVVVAAGAAPASGSYVVADKAQDRSTAFRYDALGRVTETIVAGVRVGVYNTGASALYTEIVDVRTANAYDLLGNLVKTVDGNGNSVRRFYNGAGQLVAQLDAARYLTVWTRDAFGEVAQETQYANAVAASLAIGDDITLAVLTAAGNLTASGNDRITRYVRDNLGRISVQSRENVRYGVVDPATGRATEATAAAVTRYEYDGLSNVSTLTDATGAVTLTRYDGIGRKDQEKRPGYTDYLGNLVTPTTDYEYNGLNNVARQIVRAAGGNTAADRVTTYRYGIGGHLIGQTDATKASIVYKVDAAGTIVRKTLEGMKDPSGQALVNVTDYWYDPMGRETKHVDQATGVSAETRYNTFGDITGKRANGGNVWTETTEYNNAGRAWRTNAGDGVSKVYLHDANGNATAKIDSDKVDLRTQSEEAIYRSTSYHQAFSVYDARNNLVDTIQPTIEGEYNRIMVRQVLTDAQGVSYVGGWVSVTGSTGADYPGGINEVTGTAKGVASVFGVFDQKFTLESSYRYKANGQNFVNSSASHKLTLTLPRSISPSRPITVRWALDPNERFEQFYTEEVLPYKGVIELSANEFNSVDVVDPVSSRRGFSYAITQTLEDGSVVSLGSYEGLVGAAANQITSGSVKTGKNVILFDQQHGWADRLILLTRPTGGNSGWVTTDVPRTGAGRFELDWSNWPRSSFDYKYVVLDSSDNVLNAQVGSFRLDDLTISEWAVSRGGYGPAGNAGTAYMDTFNNLYLSEMGINSSQIKIRFRPINSNQAWTEVGPLGLATVGSRATNGWFAWNLGPLQGDYEYVVEPLDSSGRMQYSARATFTVGSPNSVTGLRFFTPVPSRVSFTGQSDQASYMAISYRPDGSNEEFRPVPVAATKIGNGAFVWDTSAVFSSYTSTVNFEYRYETFDGQNVLINKAHGVVALGAVPRVIGEGNDFTPTMMSFAVPAGTTGAAYAELKYALKGSGAVVTVSVPVNGAGVFVRDVSNLIAPGTSGVLDYIYTLLAADGGPLYAADGTLITVSGTLTLGPTKSSSELIWSAEPFKDPAEIHRQQRFNAFGEVIWESDTNGYVTDLTYNTLGKLVLKQENETSATLANGFRKTLRPTTAYMYDLSGRLIAVRDANGNESSQVLVNGADEVAKQFNADGSFKTHGYDIFGDLRYTRDELLRQTDYSYDMEGRLTRVDRPVRSNGTRVYDSYEYDAAGNRYRHTTSPGAGVVYTDATYYDSLGRVIQTVTPLGRTTVYSYLWDAGIVGMGGATAGGWRKTTTDSMGRTIVDDIDQYNHLVRHTDLGGKVFTYEYNHAGWLTRQSGTSGQDIRYEYYANGYVRNIQDVVSGSLTSYAYDKKGNRTYEANWRTVNGVVEYLQNSSIKYDEQNRVVEIVDPRATIRYEYDAVGNRRRVWSYYHDGVDGSAQVQDYWYNYDRMNRFTVTMGQLSGGVRAASENDGRVTIGLGGKGSQGVKVSYNLAGERVQAIYANDGRREDYTYGVEGYLEDTYINTGTADSTGALFSRRTNDLLGRTLQYAEYQNGVAQSYTRNATYDADNRQLTETGSIGSATYRYYGSRNADGTDNAGSVSAGGFGELASLTVVKDGTTTVTSNTYEYWDQAKQKQATIQASNPNVSGLWKPGSTSYRYDVNGHIIYAKDIGADGVAGTANDIEYQYINNAQGMILRRERVVGTEIRPSHMYLYANGVTVGDIGNDGPQMKDYGQILAETPASREALYKNWKPVSSADFDQNFQPINREYPAATSSNYVVSNGDTLYAIAARVWGDSSLWYLIADANGLMATSDLTAGQTLTIPNKVANQHNTSSTMRPYDAGKRIGDTNPTLPDAPPPPPPPKKGCGIVGQLIVAVVAVAVTVVTAGAASGFVGYMAAGALGSMAGQAAAMAMGMQSGMNWGAVATSALISGATFGMGDVAAGLGVSQSASPFINASINAAVRNVAAQGISMMTGQQRQFSWASVAASAISAPATVKLNDALLKSNSALADWVTDNRTGSLLVSSSVSSVVSASTRVMVVGGKVNWAAVATDAFGNALGSSLASSINGGGRTLSPRPISDFTSIGAVDSSGPQVDIPGLLSGLPPVATDLATALKEFEPSFLERNASALEAQRVAADNEAYFGDIAKAYDRFGKAYTNALVSNIPAPPSFTIRDANNPLGLDLSSTPPLLLNKFGVLDTRPPVGEQLVPINDSVDQSYLRTGNRLTTIMLAGFPGAALPGAIATWRGQSESQIQAANEVGGSIAGVEMALSSMPPRQSVVFTPRGIINQPVESGGYVPRDSDGGMPILSQRLVQGVGDVPLPYPNAVGPHTTIGTKLAQDGVTIYRQTATFTSGTWPPLDGNEVPWGRVDWSAHAYTSEIHQSPHIHEFYYDVINKQWRSTDAKPFSGH